MAVGQTQLVRGQVLLDRQGRRLKKCCCGHCGICTQWALSYDLTFGGVNLCGGPTCVGAKVSGPARVDLNPFIGGCAWDRWIAGTPGPFNTPPAEGYFEYASFFATVLGSPSAVLEHRSAAKSPFSDRYFMVPMFFASPGYGPNCLVPISASNVYGASDCSSLAGGTSCGWGGTAHLAPVMPP
jgi:hypothetical protein